MGPSNRSIRPMRLAVPDAMITVIKTLLASILAAFRGRRNLVLENIALRRQLAVPNSPEQHVTRAILCACHGTPDGCRYRVAIDGHEPMEKECAIEAGKQSRVDCEVR